MLEELIKEDGLTNKIYKMTTDKFDKTQTIMRHIDTQINKNISEGKNISEIIEYLNDKRMKFEKVLENCKDSEVRYKFLFTHNKVCVKRILDFYYIETLAFNYEEYKNYPLKKLFSLVQLRDKLVNNFSVELN